jgi:hypothetical protein
MGRDASGVTYHDNLMDGKWTLTDYASLAAIIGVPMGILSLVFTDRGHRILARCWRWLNTSGKRPPPCTKYRVDLKIVPMYDKCQWQASTTGR